jgi:hypothetical protein
MKRLVWIQLASLVLLAGAAVSQAPAQIPFGSPLANPYYRSPVSPYLGLTLPGNTAINYYGVVRPQIDQLAALQQVQSQLGSAPGYAGGLNSGLLVTGHVSQFQDHWGYFQNWRGGQYGGAGAGLGLNPGLAGITPGLGGLSPGLGTGVGIGLAGGTTFGNGRPNMPQGGRPMTPGAPVH